MTQPYDSTADTLRHSLRVGELMGEMMALIERWAENFGLDLRSPVEAALVQQEVEHVAQLVEAAHEAGRQGSSDAIVAHADEWAPADGNTEQRRMRRHLMIAARVAAPEPTIEDIRAALAAGNYALCYEPDSPEEER
jgi:sugar diacid utilization regulator